MANKRINELSSRVPSASDLMLVGDPTTGYSYKCLVSQVGGVQSVFGRTGAVTAQEGDYTLTQLGDVTITSPQLDQVLVYNGGAWVNTENYSNKVQHYVKLGAAISKGSVVYVSGASGTNMVVNVSSNDSEATSSKVLGVTAAGGALNDMVYVITEGLLPNIDTSGSTIGDAVWLGSNGALIFGVANRPVPPLNAVYIGVVTRVSATVGEIFIRVQNGFELDELHDVKFTSLSNNQALVYNTTTSLWENRTLTTSVVTEGTNLYYTDARARGAISLTTTGSGAATYNSTTGVLNIPTPSSVNLYNSDGTLTGNRTVTLSTNSLTIAGSVSHRFYSNGNVGIGTTTDAGFRLDVNGTMRVQGTLNLSNAANTRTIAFDDANGGLFVYMRQAAGTISGTNGGYYVQTSDGNAWTINNNTNNFHVGANSPTSGTNSAVTILGLASNQAAISIGINSTASGRSGVAIGDNANVSGTSTNFTGVAIGTNAKVTGFGVAFGYTTADAGEFSAASAITFGGLVPITNVYFGSGKSLNDPSGTARTGNGVAYTINGSGAAGTDFAGGNVTIAGGRGTGTGTPGDVIFSTSTATTTGTTLQTLTNRVWVKGQTGFVGIGTSSPAYLLDVNGTAKANKLLINTSTDAGFTADVNGTMRVQGAVTVTTGGVNVTGASTFQTSILSFGVIESSNSFLTPLIGNRNTNSRLLLTYGLNAASQIVIRPNNDGTQINHPSAALQIDGYDVGGGFKGFLLPRMTTTQRDAISSPATGLMVYDTTGNTLDVYNGTQWLDVLASDFLTIDNTNNRLGINNTSPSYDLHVIGTGQISGNVLMAQSTATVGIGTVIDTSYKLSVDGSARFYGSIRTAQPTGGVSVADWKLGSTATGTFTMDTGMCVEVEIGGTLRKLAIVT